MTSLHLKEFDVAFIIMFSSDRGDAGDYISSIISVSRS